MTEIQHPKVPQKIHLNLTIKNQDFIIYVPEEGKTAYQNALPNLSYLTLIEDTVFDYDEKYEVTEFKPIVLTSNTETYQPQIFQDSYGVYQVINEGQKDVKLLYAKKPLILHKYTKMDPAITNDKTYWGEASVFPTATYDDSTIYTVTTLGTCSLRDFRYSVLSIPDTITAMEDQVVSLQNLKVLFLSKNLEKLPNQLFCKLSEENEELALIYIPQQFKNIESTLLVGAHTELLMVANGTTLHKNVKKYQANKIDYYNITKKSVLAQSISFDRKSMDAYISKTYQYDAKISNKNTTEKLKYISLDPSTIKVDAKGVITPKQEGDGYL